MPAWLRSLDRCVFLMCKYGTILCLVGLFVLLASGIVGRLVPAVRLRAGDELIELLVVWMVFMGAVALWREGALYRVVVIQEQLPAPLQRLLALVIEVAMLALALVLAVKGYDFVRMAGETTMILRADKAWWYAAVPVAGALMAVYSAAGVVRCLARIVRPAP